MAGPDGPANGIPSAEVAPFQLLHDAECIEQTQLAKDKKIASIVLKTPSKERIDLSIETKRDAALGGVIRPTILGFD